MQDLVAGVVDEEAQEEKPPFDSPPDDDVAEGAEPVEQDADTFEAHADKQTETEVAEPAGRDGEYYIPADSPFQFQEEGTERAKIFLYGDKGSGKTLLSLQFPRVAIIDTERGSQIYKRYRRKIAPIYTNNFDKAMQQLRWLQARRHPFATLVIDSITPLWQDCMRKWYDIFLEKNRRGTGHKGEFYEFQASDWGLIKGDWNLFLNLLVALDMNVIVTAREKVLRAGEDASDGNFMKKIGVAAESEKGTQYMFDLVFNVAKLEDANGNSSHVMKCEKARGDDDPDITQRHFKNGFVPISYTHIAEFYGGDSVISRVSSPVEMATKEQVEQISGLLEKLNVSAGALKDALANHNATKVSELSLSSATSILAQLQKSVEARASS